MANNISEIDIATLNDYKKKGLAKIIAEEFIEDSIRRNISANWDCFEENTPSLRTAESLKFTRLREYLFLSIYNRTKDDD